MCLECTVPRAAQFPGSQRPRAVLRAALLPALGRAAEGCGPRLRLVPSEGSPPSPPEPQLCSGFVGETVLVFRHRRKFTLV